MRRVALALAAAALPACSGIQPEPPLPPIARVGVLPTEGDLLKTPELEEFHKALRKILRGRGYEVVELPAGPKGDPWHWTSEERRAAGVEGLLRTRVHAMERGASPSVLAEAQLVDVETGRTRHWHEARIRPTSPDDPLLPRAALLLLARLPSAR